MYPYPQLNSLEKYLLQKYCATFIYLHNLWSNNKKKSITHKKKNKQLEDVNYPSLYHQPIVKNLAWHDLR